ncbi:MAG TPA: cyclic nucleotide-binding domain-containing protein [Myxococcota bacterium]|nr:cyclic nucleotide-binding domain-containing protein [Myxococcota bacterium]
MSEKSFDDFTAGNLLFKTLDEAARQRVLELARLEKYSKGDTIIEQDETGDDIYLLKSGKVDVQTMQEGFIIELTTLEPGSIFGEVAEVSNVRRTATIVAKEDVEVLRFLGPELVEELRKHPTASKLLDHIVLHRAKDTIEKTFGY